MDLLCQCGGLGLHNAQWGGGGGMKKLFIMFVMLLNGHICANGNVSKSS